MVSARLPDLDSLQLLLDVAEHGSLGKAAVAHGISQPAVSARIRSMEALVGFTLLLRGARGSSLTPAGALVADWARQVLAAGEVLGAGIDSLRTDGERELTVAASLTVAEHLLPGWLVHLAATRPDTTVRLRAMNSADVATALLSATADLGFVEGPGVPAGLNARVVARDRLAVVVPPHHPWARRRDPVSARELAGTRLVHREPTSGTRLALEAALATYAPLAPALLELSTSSAVRSAVIAGAGPAVLSLLAVQDDLRTGQLVEVRTSGAAFGRSLRAVWPRGHRPTGPAADLLAITGRAS